MLSRPSQRIRAPVGRDAKRSRLDEKRPLANRSPELCIRESSMHGRYRRRGKTTHTNTSLSSPQQTNKIDGTATHESRMKNTLTHSHTHTQTHFRVDVWKSRKHAEKDGWPEGRQACNGRHTFADTHFQVGHVHKRHHSPTHPITHTLTHKSRIDGPPTHPLTNPPPKTRSTEMQSLSSNRSRTPEGASCNEKRAKKQSKRKQAVRSSTLPQGRALDVERRRKAFHELFQNVSLLLLRVRTSGCADHARDMSPYVSNSWSISLTSRPEV